MPWVDIHENGAYPELKLEWAPFDPPSAENPDWVDISRRLRDWEWGYGRNDELGEFEPGSGFVTLDNRDRALDPAFTGPTAGVSQMTLSGNEITDASRALGTQGDGLSDDGSMGVWEATTNLVPNGGFETDTTGWITGGTNTIATDTAQAKFGSRSCKATYSNDITMVRRSGQAAAGAGAHTYSAWIYIPANWDGGTLRLRLGDFTGATGTLTANANMSLRDQWQRVTVANVGIAGGDLTGDLHVEISGAAPTVGRFFYVDGIQFENQPIGTPYVHTDGSTASRSVARVQAPASLVDETQGWCALRIRPGWASTADIHGGNAICLLEWADSDGERITLEYDVTADIFTITRRTGGSGSLAQSASQTFAAGDALTLVAAWTATLVKISVNGVAFVTQTQNLIPTLAATLVDLGQKTVGNTNWIDGDVLWFACGTGTLTDGDAASIHAKASAPAEPWRIHEMLPDAAATTCVWTAEDKNFDTPAPWQGNVKIRRMFRLTNRWSGVEHARFTAHAKSIPQTYPGGFDAVARVELADDLAILMAVDLDALGFDRPEERSDDRVNAVLDEADIPQARRAISQGTVNVAAVAAAEVPGSTASIGSALKQTKQVSESSESSPLYVSRAGKVTAI